jgi:hypothetical protein
MATVSMTREIVQGAAQAGGFREARREVKGVTADLERRILAWMCARVPASVQSDHLTALGLLATMGAGAAYAWAGDTRAWLHVVNVCLALNWLGDSLDGTLARYRREERPRYGFYVDHVIDAIGAVWVVGGLAGSGLISSAVGAVLVVAYFLTAIHVYLAAHAAGTFKISYGPVGGTELRLVLVVANLVAWIWPVVPIAGLSVRVFDVLGVSAAAGLGLVLLFEVPRLSMELRRAEPGRAGK